MDDRKVVKIEDKEREPQGRIWNQKRQEIEEIG